MFGAIGQSIRSRGYGFGLAVTSRLDSTSVRDDSKLRNGDQPFERSATHSEMRRASSRAAYNLFVVSHNFRLPFVLRDSDRSVSRFEPLVERSSASSRSALRFHRVSRRRRATWRDNLGQTVRDDAGKQSGLFTGPPTASRRRRSRVYGR